jgi:aminopeptidase N
MENWGLLLLDEARVFHDPATDSSAYKKFLMVDVVCHEAAHQWIGNLVTCPDWMQV